MKKRLLKLIQTKETARSALVAKSEKSEDIKELRSIQAQIDGINGELNEIRAMVADIEAEEARSGAPEGDEGELEARTAAVTGVAAQPPVTAPAAGESRQFTPGKGFAPVPEGSPGATEDRAKLDVKEREKRGKDLLEGRSVSVASSNIVLPKVASSTINGTFQQVSSLIDGVDLLVLRGGESFTQPYEMETPDGAYTAEGAAPADTDVAFGKADITKAKVTAYSEITNEVKKLPAADYENVVVTGISRSARKKISKEILVGDGGTNHLSGIFSTTATAIAASDLSIASITNTTLSEIIFSYGGDEAVEDAAVLILNKADLKAFSQLRTADGKPFHTIVSKGNFGTIDGVPYIINSACGAISKTTTATGAYCMAYGSLSNYKLVVFSELDVQRSTDYKFKEGMICHRGEVYVGGNVVVYNGFVRIKKAAAA